jgi:hypothetical protein
MKTAKLIEFLRAEYSRMVDTGDPEELTKRGIHADEAFLIGYRVAIADVEAYAKKGK